MKERPMKVKAGGNPKVMRLPWPEFTGLNGKNDSGCELLGCVLLENSPQLSCRPRADPKSRKCEGFFLDLGHRCKWNATYLSLCYLVYVITSLMAPCKWRE